MKLSCVMMTTCLICMGTGMLEASALLSSEARAELMRCARRWSVPQPEKGAAILKLPVYLSGDDVFSVFAFRSISDPSRALLGFEHRDIKEREFAIAPNDQSLEKIATSSPFESPYELNTGLITGIQMLWEGHEKLGTALIEKSLGTSSGNPHTCFFSPAGEDPALMLARSCLAAAVNEVTSAKPDFSGIRERIRILIEDQPKLKCPATSFMMDALEASAKHAPRPQGTIERVVDDFLLGGGSDGATRGRTGEFSPEGRALILLGFDAVPVLIKEMGSGRVTNHLMQGFNNFSSFPMTADMVISAYLQRLSNDELGSNWLERQKGLTVDRDRLLAWWAKASQAGERAYVSNHTILSAPDGAKLSLELLLIASVRYPDLIPEFYRKACATDHPSWNVGMLLKDSKTIPGQEKIRIFKETAEANHKAHRNFAMDALQELDPTLADRLLLERLRKCPKTATENYWLDQDAQMGRLVSQSDSTEVWRELGTLLERVDLGMRMELIAGLHPSIEAPREVLEAYFNIYDRYCEVKVIRDESSSEKFSGPGAGFPFSRLAVRDFMHMHWAAWLQLKLDHPTEKWTPSEWKTYREAVGAAVKTARRKLTYGD